LDNVQELYKRVLNGDGLSLKESQTIFLDIQRRDPGSTHDAMKKYVSAAGQNTYQILVAEIADQFLAKRMLDLGCGTGDLVRYLGRAFNHSYSGIDQSESEIAIARKSFPDWSFDFGRAEAMPYGRNEFECIVSHMFLHMVSDLGGTLSEIRRVLKPGGVFVSLYRDPGYVNSNLKGIREIIWGYISKNYPKFSFKVGNHKQGDSPCLEEQMFSHDFKLRAQNAMVLKDQGSPAKVSETVVRMFPGALLPMEDQKILASEIQSYLEQNQIDVEFGFKTILVSKE